MGEARQVFLGGAAGGNGPLPFDGDCDFINIRLKLLLSISVFMVDFLSFMWFGLCFCFIGERRAFKAETPLENCSLLVT